MLYNPQNHNFPLTHLRAEICGKTGSSRERWGDSICSLGLTSDSLPPSRINSIQLFNISWKAKCKLVWEKRVLEGCWNRLFTPACILSAQAPLGQKEDWWTVGREASLLDQVWGRKRAAAVGTAWCPMLFLPPHLLYGTKALYCYRKEENSEENLQGMDEGVLETDKSNWKQRNRQKKTNKTVTLSLGEEHKNILRSDH